MICLAVPLGSHYGWGVCGKYIALEMARLAEVRLWTEPIVAQAAGDELEHYALAQLMAGPADEQAIAARGGLCDGPLLQCITGKDMLPYRPGIRGNRTVGYTFFEENLLPPHSLENARRHFQHVATGSSWCTEVLRQAGLGEVSTVVQGVDPTVFGPAPQERQYLRDKFVVFSGGKLELRKGQDLVIRAYKVLQDKHRDVALVTSWVNGWAFSLNTMRASPFIRFAPTAQDHATMVKQVLEANGIDVSRTINLTARPNVTMARIYKNSDVGLFPNRCEGGTNLVLMEYMACGKPAIASFSTGHKDILTPENSIRIEGMKPMTLHSGTAPVAVWDNPDLDETIAHLEYAYHHRERLQQIGRQAGCDLARFTWRETAAQFHALLDGRPQGTAG